MKYPKYKITNELIDILEDIRDFSTFQKQHIPHENFRCDKAIKELKRYLLNNRLLKEVYIK